MLKGATGRAEPQGLLNEIRKVDKTSGRAASCFFRHPMRLKSSSVLMDPLVATLRLMERKSVVQNFQSSLHR